MLFEMVAFPSAWVSHYEKQSPLLTDNVQVVWAGNKSFFTILKLKMQALNINLKYWDCLLLQLHIGEGDGTPLQRSCLENPMDGGAWWAAVHGVEKSRTRLSDFTFTFHSMHWRRTWQPTPVFLPGESQGWQSLVGCCLWCHTESDTTEAT